MADADLEVIWCRDRYEVLRRATTLAGDGLILEFGVASGRSLNFIAELVHPRKVFGFDWFRGLPEPWGGYPQGHFACSPPDVAENAGLIIGLFEDTLAPFLAEHHEHAALIHVDCDLYSSTTTILETLRPRIIRGTIIVFDEFWICSEHERLAFEDFLFFGNRTCRYDSRAAEQLCVVME
jgi:hypothetical protein